MISDQFMYRLERLYALMEEVDRREIRRGRSEIKRLKILFERKREELAGRLKLESAGATTSTTSSQPDTAANDKPDSELTE